MKIPYKYLILPLFLMGLGLSSCVKQKEEQLTYLAGNRTMGLMFRNVGVPPNSTRSTHFPLLEKALQNTYGAKVWTWDMNTDSVLESPENLFQIATHDVDDIFVTDLYTNSSDSQSENLDVSMTIYNGSNLRAVTIAKISVPIAGDDFEKRFQDQFKKSLLEIFPNPNIYPKNSPEHFANLLYVFSKKVEDEHADDLSCDNAADVLKYYEKARDLYQKALEKGPSKVVGTQEEVNRLQTRLTESTEKAATVKTCEDDKSKVFGLDFDFGKIDPSQQEFIRSAFETAKIEELLKKYTDKPVNVKFILSGSDDLSLQIELRFDGARYKSWTGNRVPSTYKNYRPLSLDPYYALMQKMVVFKSSLPNTAPMNLKILFNHMRMNLVLNTLLKGEALFGVAGEFFPERNSVRMAYPNTIYITAPGYGQRTIATKSSEVFQEKGWLALGSCKTVEGTLTEDGLAYRFFDLPCH